MTTSDSAAAGRSSTAEGTAAFLAHYSAVTDAEHHEHRGASPFRKWLEMIRPERAEIRMIVLFTAIVGLLALASPIAVEALVNSVAFGGLIQPVVVLTLILLACLAFAAGLTAFEYYLTELIQRRLFLRAAAKATSALIRGVPIHGPQTNPTVMVNRFLEIVQIQKITAALLLDGISIVLTTLIGMVVLAFYHPILLAFDIGLIIAILLLIFPMSRRGVTTAVHESLAKHALVRWLEQISLSGVRFHSARGAQLGSDVAAALTAHYLEARTDHFRIVFRQLTLGLAIQVLSLVLLLGLGGWLVISGQMTLGQLVAAELIIALVTGQLAKVGKYLESFYDLMASVDKLDSLLDHELERAGGELPDANPAGASLDLREIAFRFDADHTVLRELNVDIEPGKSLAVLGEEGSGKTLLAEILVGRRLPTAGVVEIDGVDLRQWNLAALRDRVAYVGEENGLLEATLFENVRQGRDAVDSDAVRAALATVELLPEATLLQDGLESRIEAAGSPLSQGQARRLRLAAALAGKPSLLIIDGLLDACDDERRRRIWHALRRDYPSTTLLLTRDRTAVGLCDSMLELPRPTPASLRSADGGRIA
jgi:ABC-type bacteriocin/lantibiotic exporter with double-glycine peptidase domain